MLAEKLDFLMKLTNTSNSALGKILNFDASYISRIRSGKRGVPKHQPFIEPAAAYFARRLTQPYQKKAAAELLIPGKDWPDSEEEAARLIATWLTDEGGGSFHPVGQLLSGLSRLETEKSLPKEAPFERTSALENTTFFYGHEGKRRAVELFLSRCCSLQSGTELLLYSDEDFSWLYENEAFARLWASLLMRLIMQGGTIRIIHTVSRSIHEMLEAVQKWLPIYMTGAIEPYFYPKIRDNVYHRTLFIARGQMAVLASSVGDHPDDGLNFFVDDPRAVRALELEFQDYFSLCRPLVKIFSPRDFEPFYAALSELEEQSGNLIVANQAPSLFTLPPDIVSRMAERLEEAGALKGGAPNVPRLLTCHAQSQARFRSHLERGESVTEILHLPTVWELRKTHVPIPLCIFTEQPAACYTPEEFRMHLTAVLALLEHEPNYHIVLTELVPEQVVLLCKEDVGSMLLRPLSPGTALSISEPRMNASFWEYLTRVRQGGKGRQQTVRQLKEYLRMFDEAKA